MHINFNHRKALIRVDFNVPLSDALEVQDNTRILGALPTIRKVLADGGSAVLMSHLGRPKGVISKKYSLQNVVTAVSEALGQEVSFVSDCIGEEVKAKVAGLQAGEVLLLENLRFHKAEKKGDPEFAKALADLGCDVYINDAFGTAHRAHASTHTIAQFFSPENRSAGLLLQKELTNAHKVLNEAERPFTAILGGAKVSDKILLIENLLDKVDYILIGGAMAYTFQLAKGGQIGKSLVELDKVDLAKSLLEKSAAKKVEILLPDDSVIADAFDNAANRQTVSSLAIPDAWMGLDIGPSSQLRFAEVIAQSKTILWNGPMGVFEMSNFKHGTEAVAQAVAKATQENGAYSLIGGGDSVAAIKGLGLADAVSYVSTGGGAMLELLEGKALPGVVALEH